MFSEWVGIDATSIWAAATSGPTAITVHLLACMIARMFTNSEATSIWHELVERRKEQLLVANEEGMAEDSDILASRCTISRIQLAEWDASARAWLQTADQAMAVRQTRLMSAIEELKLPIENGPSLLDTVVRACTAALEGMERLIQGVAQRVQSPAVLLGLSCWHIYPDILVLGTSKIEPIKQNDPLVADGGLLTIGMQLESETDESIFWSLPLSFLRWYGDPVVTRGSIGPAHARISPDELVFVTMGCLFAVWGLKAEDDTTAMDWITLIFNKVDQAQQNIPRHLRELASYYKFLRIHSWFSLMNRAAHHFLDCEGEERREYQRLISLGRRKRNFLGVTPSAADLTSGFWRSSININGLNDPLHKPIFGFFDIATVLRSLQTGEARTEFLRQLAQRKKLDPKRYMIRYKTYGHSGSSMNKETLELASIGPIIASHVRKRRQNGEEALHTKLVNARWRSTTSVKLGGEFFHGEEPVFTAEDKFFNLSSSSTELILAAGDHAIIWMPSDMILFTGAIVRAGMQFQPNGAQLENITPADIRALLPGFHFTWMALVQHFGCSAYTPLDGDEIASSLARMLCCIGDIMMIYKLLPGATISTKILQRPIPQKFFNKTQPFIQHSAPRTFAFALVAYCESGYCVLNPDALSNVFAMSTGDSIFIYGQLLSDPGEGAKPHELRRLHGNIGRSGIALLISPTDPRVREPEDDHWRVINHDSFDGTAIDSFEATSLHLSFTNFVLPLSVQTSGNRDSEAYLLESVVSIHDKGKWVADIDLLSALKRCFYVPKVCPGDCGASSELLGSADSGNYLRQAIGPNNLTAIDCWEELLDPPGGNIIARAHKNWIARLALLSVSSQLRYKAIVLPGDFCFTCWESNKMMIRPIADYLRTPVVGAKRALSLIM